ncbi:hypothetical protein PV325_007566 [Microctonus aethiopoides]|nr:hypothetical protein PV325_007566 [Microctonus aethiopoides]
MMSAITVSSPTLKTLQAFDLKDKTYYTTMKTIIAATLLVGYLTVVNAHTYHMGACPVVEPQQGFEMNKFLGYWYVIQKTSTGSKCVGYNYTRGDEPGSYVITQDSNHLVLGLTPLKHQYHYTGELTVPQPSIPALMEVRFPLSVAGSASHIVFATDYNTYAGIFTCQKLAFAHRQSATILSRDKELDHATLDMLHQKLKSFGVNSYDLSIVPQVDCNVGSDPVDININPDTFSKENLGKVLNKAGEKLGQGAEWVAQTGSSVYRKIVGTEPPTDQPKSYPQATVASLIPSHDNIENNEVEWIP